MKLLELRNDDVLQVNSATKFQRNAFREKDPFQWFLEADRVFKDNAYPCTLAILAEGIDFYPEWVDYIIKNRHRYRIELHGLSHSWYHRMSEKEGYEDLKLAKKMIEDAFNCEVTTWYVPFGRKNIPEWGHRVCKKLGIVMDVPKGKTLPKQYKKDSNYINFHYWSKEQVNRVNKIIKEL